jgi:hypothetical protein
MIPPPEPEKKEPAVFKGVETESVASVDPAVLAFDFDFDSDIDRLMEEEFFNGDTQTVYTDLHPTDLYTKDQIAEQVRRDKSFKFYFSPENIGKTAKELYDEEQAKIEENNYQSKFNFLFDGGYDLDDMDDSFFKKSMEDLETMAKSFPQREKPAPLERPNEIQLALAGLFELAAAPGQQFRALAIPFEYALAKNARKLKEADERYHDRLREWQVRFGIKKDQAETILKRTIGEYEVKQRHLQSQMETRYGAMKAEGEWEAARQKMLGDAQKILAESDAKERQIMLDQGYELMKNGKTPHLRLLGQSVVEIMTGLELPANVDYTPEELKQLADAQGKEISNVFDKETLEARVQKSKAEGLSAAYDAAFKPQMLSAELQRILSVANLNSVNAQVQAGNMQLDWAKFWDDSQSGGKVKSVSEALGGAVSGLDEARQKLGKEATDLLGKMNSREAEVMENIEVVKPGWGPFGPSREEAAKLNAERRKEALASDPVYQQMKKRYTELQSDIASVADREQMVRGLSPSTVNATRVQALNQKLGKAKTSKAYEDMLGKALNGGEVTVLEAVLAIKAGGPDFVDAEGIQRRLLTRLAQNTFKDAGAANEYVEAIMREVVGGGSVETQNPFFPQVGSSPMPEFYRRPSTKNPSREDQVGVAKWMAGVAQTRGVPPELPVMVGLVETGTLRNLPHLGKNNDFDSVGMFQQRAAEGSNSERTSLEWSLNKFLTLAETALKKTSFYWQEGGRLAQGGKSRTIRFEKPIGELINQAKASGNQKEYARLLGILAQEVQRSAYGERYSQRYGQAVSLLGGEAK